MGAAGWSACGGALTGLDMLCVLCMLGLFRRFAVDTPSQPKSVQCSCMHLNPRAVGFTSHVNDLMRLDQLRRDRNNELSMQR